MRNEIGQYLWKLWSPNWDFDEETYRQTAKSFDNPDFVDIVIHSYMHRIHNAPGDPRYASIEAQLAALPKIGVPTIVIHGADDEVRDRRDTNVSLPALTSAAYLRGLDTIHHKKLQKSLLAPS